MEEEEDLEELSSDEEEDLEEDEDKPESLPVELIDRVFQLVVQRKEMMR